MIYPRLLGFLLLLALGTFRPLVAQTALQVHVDAWMKHGNLEHASVSFLVLDATTGKPVAAHDPDRTLTSASTAKIFSTATMLDLYGSDHKLWTALGYTGSIDSTGTLHGDVVVVGGGDPAFLSHRWTSYYGDPFARWANVLRAQGIKKVHGRVIGDARLFGTTTGAPIHWSWNDMGNYYGAGPSALTIWENFYTIYLHSGPSHGDPTRIAKVEPEGLGIAFDNYVTSARSGGDNCYIYGAPFTSQRILLGTIPMGRRDFDVKGSLPDPPQTVAGQLSRVLNCTGPPTNTRLLGDSVTSLLRSVTMLDTIWSPRLQDLLVQTNHSSINLYAEQWAVHCAIKIGAEPSSDGGAAAITSYWGQRGVPTEGLILADGSGLSRRNAISARHLCGLLYSISKRPTGKAFKATLPQAGKSGTLSRFGDGTAIENRLHAKSGSMYKVRSYAGYLETTTGKELVVAVIVNNFEGSDSALRTRLEALLSPFVYY